MANTFIFLFLVSVIILLGLMSHSFLSKITQKGKTIIKLKIALYKILQVEFESEHNDGQISKA